MKFNVFIFIYIFHLFLILEIIHLASVNKINSIDFSNSKEKNLRQKYFTREIKNENLENYKDKNSKLYLSEKPGNRKAYPIDTIFIEKKIDAYKTNFISNNLTQYFSKNNSEALNKDFAFKSKIQIDDSHKHINTLLFNQTHKINATNNSSFIRNKKSLTKLNYKKKTNVNSALSSTKQEVDPANSDDPNQSEENENLNVNRIRGYRGYCLFKHDDHIINLNKIKSRDSNFFIKANGDVYEFNICKNIRSYDDNKKGLFINKINDVLYAGDNNVEKYLVVNEGKYAKFDKKNDFDQNPFHLGNYLDKTGLSSFNQIYNSLNKKNKDNTNNTDINLNGLNETVNNNNRKKDFINNDNKNYDTNNNPNYDESKYKDMPYSDINRNPKDDSINDYDKNNNKINNDDDKKNLKNDDNNNKLKEDFSNFNNNNSENDVIINNRINDEKNKIKKLSHNLFESEEDPSDLFETKKSNETIFESLIVYLPQGESCQNDPETGESINYTIVYEIICDTKANKAEIINESEFDPNSCFNKIKIKTKYICARYIIKYTPWYERLLMPKNYIALIFIFNGIFLMFFGKLHMRLSMSLSICLLGYTLMGALNWMDGESNAKNIVFIVILPLICLFYYGLPTYLFWIFSTFMALNFQDIFYCITAKYIIEHKIMHYEEYKVLCCLIFVSVYLIFTLQTDYHTDYWQTAFVGSYYFNRGIAIHYGDFPDRVFINLLIQFREYSQLDRSFSETSLNYIISIIILWIFSFLVQKYFLQSFKEEFIECNQSRNDNTKKNNKKGKNNKNNNKDNYNENEENFDIFNKDEEKPLPKEEKLQKQKDPKKSIRNKSFNYNNFTNKLLSSADNVKKSNIKKNDAIQVQDEENEDNRKFENLDKIPNKFQNSILSPKSEKAVSAFNGKDLNPNDDKIFYSHDFNNKNNYKKERDQFEKLNEHTFGEIKKETN